MSELFICDIINRSNAPFAVRERNGMVIATVPAGERLTLRSSSPNTLYSRFKEIVVKDGRVASFKENKNWRMPYESAFICTLRNETEVIHSMAFQLSELPANAGGFVRVLPGLTEAVPVGVEDQMCQWESVTWRWGETFQKTACAGYFRKVREVVCEKVRRSDKELDKILAERERLALEIAQREVAKQMKHERSALGVENG